jgi:uncharacterized protein
MESSERKKSTVKRVPKRAMYEDSEIQAILDRHYLAHLGFVFNGYPVVIPTLYGRDGDDILIHGAAISRMLKSLSEGIQVSVSIAEVHALVLAKSAFHHSMNYESVVLFGKGELVPDEQKAEALKCISDHLIPLRWEESRQPNEKELKATDVIRIKVDEVSAKRRIGPPNDDKADEKLDIWSGIIPVERVYLNPIQSEESAQSLPKSVKNLLEKRK